MPEVDFLPITASESRTELANARRFIAQYTGRVRYVPQWGRWLTWTGQRWLLDTGCDVVALAKGVAESVWAEATAELPNVDGRTAKELVSFARATAHREGHRQLLAARPQRTGGEAGRGRA